MNEPTRIILAVCEALAPAAVVISSAMLPGSDAGNLVTRNEVVTAVVASIVTGAAYARALRQIVLNPTHPLARRAAAPTDAQNPGLWRTRDPGE